MAFQRPVLKTGVPGLDVLLGGGIPERQTLLITGQPGSGKTVLASQIAAHLASQGVRSVLSTTTSESQSKLLEDLAGFSFFDSSRVGEELFFLSIYAWLKKGPREAREILINTVRERKAKLLIIDGLRSVRDLWQDEAMLREFFYELSVGLAAAQCTALFITEYPLARLIEFAESTTVDGILSLSFEEARVGRVRRAEVVKLRGLHHLAGKHVMLMGDDGVRIVPRIESVSFGNPAFAPPPGRAGFGLPELDEILHGGLPCSTSTLLAGSSGVGKTLLSLHFAAEGATKEEPTLVLSFTEPELGLVARARRVNLDLTGPLKSGRLKILYRPSLELEADEIVDRLFEDLRRTGARRLVVEDADVLEATLEERPRAHAFFAALMIRLRDMGVTALFTRKISKVVGPELDFSDTALSNLAENLVFMRLVELRGRLHRVMSVLNLRDSAFDPSLREFEIADSGVRVMSQMTSAEGLLTGLARPVGSAVQDGRT